VVLTVGLLVFLGMFNASQSIEEVTNAYFAESNFADAFASVLSMPESDLDDLKKIDGVRDVHGVLTKNTKGLIVDNGSADDIVYIKLVAADMDQEISINKYTYTGTMLRNKDDVWLSKGFYQFHNLEIGDMIYVIINGVRKPLRVCGYVESPEYLLVEGNLTSEGKYTVGFIDSTVLEGLTGMSGQVTDVSIAFNKWVKYREVEAVIKEKLMKYGLVGMKEKNKHVSHSTVMENVDTLLMISTAVPILFLAISIIMLYIILRRCIEQDRTEIGLMKAIGFTNSEILIGYLIYAVMIGVLSFVLSCAAGYLLGNVFYSMVITAFELPDFGFSMRVFAGIFALAIAITVCMIAVVLGVKSITVIQPSEAMRPVASDENFGRQRVHINFAAKYMNFNKFMGLKLIFRKKYRSLLTVLSIMLTFTLLHMLIVCVSSLDAAINSYGMLTNTYDLAVSLNNFVPKSTAIRDIFRLEGIHNAEGLLQLPVTIFFENKRTDIMMAGIDDSTTLYNVIDENYRKQIVPKSGAILNDTKAKQLRVNIGDHIRIEGPYFEEDQYIEVVSIIREPFSVGCYMSLSQMNSLLGGREAVNSILLTVSSEYMSEIKESLTYAANILEINEQKLQVKRIVEQSASNKGLFYMLALMSALMCLGVIYNVSRISVTERSKCFATMRMIGFTVRETAEVVAFGNWVLFVLGAILGLIATALVKEPFASLINTEEVTLLLDLSVASAAMTTACGMFAVVLSNRMSRRQIGKYQMIEIIRERE
jgi:putative ABC transport system permease protein